MSTIDGKQHSLGDVAREWLRLGDDAAHVFDGLPAERQAGQGLEADMAELTAAVMKRLELQDERFERLERAIADLTERQDRLIDYYAGMCESFASGMERLRKTS